MRLSRFIFYASIGAVLVLGLESCRSRTVANAISYDSNAGAESSLPLPPLNTDATDVDLHPVVAEARRWLGVPYRYGGKDRNGTDCSGLVMEVYRLSMGMMLPRSSFQQYDFCTPIPLSDVRVADLVFFRGNSSGGKVSHVGIYIGEGEFIHSSTSRGVIISRLDERYYDSHYFGAGRILGDVATPSYHIIESNDLPIIQHVEEPSVIPVVTSDSDSISTVIRNAFVF